MAQNMMPENYQPSQHFLNQLKRLPCEPSQSVTSSRHSINSGTMSEEEGEKAIQEFKREIQARFQISVSNKMYNFPRNLDNIDDLVSSEQEQQLEDNQIQENSQEILSYLKPKLQKQQYLFNEQCTDRQKNHDNRFKKQAITTKSGKKTTQLQTKTQSRKKSKNSKTSQRRKQNQMRMQRSDREVAANQSKRLNTQPSSMNYLQTIKLKIQKKH